MRYDIRYAEHYVRQQNLRNMILALFFGLAVLGLHTQSAAAQGNVIEVTTTAPEISADGACSLAEAIENANAADQVHADCAAGTGNDTIRLAASETYTFTLAHNDTQGGNALPAIEANITIDGRGSTLARATDPGVGDFRFFYVTASSTLTLDDVNLTGGDPTVVGTVVLFEAGGAIYTDGALHVRNSVLFDNVAAQGGAIYASASASVSVGNSTFSNNRALFDGGAILSHGAVEIAGSVFDANRALEGEGGALSIRSGEGDTSAQIHTSEISSNMAELGGGGIAARSTGGFTLSMTIARSQLVSNTVDALAGLGGGLLVATDEPALNDEPNGENGNGENGNGENGNDENGNGENGNGENGNGENGNDENGNDENGNNEVENSASQNIQQAGVSHAHVTVVDSTIRTNHASDGGGIAAQKSGTSAQQIELIVLRSLLVDNEAGHEAGGEASLWGNGGGIYNAGATLVIANSTLSHNHARGSGAPVSGVGGALANLGLEAESHVEIVNSSVVSNTAAQSGGGLANFRPVVTTTARITLENTLLAFNSSTVPNTNTCSSDVSQSIVSLGHNLESHNSCGLDQSGDIVNTDPWIAGLADNGGPTMTHALRPSSPAIGAANPAACLAAPVSQDDQRGAFRLSVVCDIGAFEFDVAKKLVPIMERDFPEIEPEPETEPETE